MALIDDIISKLEAIPTEPNGSLILTPQKFAIPFMDDFFARALKTDYIAIADAVVTPGQETASVQGRAALLGYPDLGVSMVFLSIDNQVVITVQGTFAPGKTVQLPVITWVSIKDIGMTIRFSQPYEIVNFQIQGNFLVPDGSRQAVIPLRLSKPDKNKWQLAIADDSDVTVTANQLVALVGGKTLTSFLPEALVDILAGIEVKGISSTFDTSQNTISYFAVGVSVTNGWDISSKIRLKPGLGISLTLVDPTSSTSMQIVGEVKGTFSLNGTDVPVFVQGSAGLSTLWNIGVQPDHKVTLPSFSDLLGLAGGQDFLNSLPPAFSQIPQIVINKLIIMFDPVAVTLNRIDFAVSTKSTWPIISGYFEVTNIYVALDIGNILSPGEQTTAAVVRSTFNMSGVFVQCSIEKKQSDSEWTVTGSLPPGKVLNLTQIAVQLFEGKITLPDSVPQIVFNRIDITVIPSTGYFSFLADSTSEWKIIENFSIKTFHLDFNRDPSKPGTPIAGTISSKLGISTVDLTLSASLNNTPNGGWQFDGSTGQDQEIAIGQLIAYIAAVFGVNDLPDSISQITLKNVELSFNTATKNFKFKVTGTFPMADGNLEISVDIALENNGDGTFQAHLSGTLKIGSSTFVLDFTSGGDEDTLKGSWTLKEGETLGFNDIANALGLSAPDIPPDLDLGLKEAAFIYDFDNERFELNAASVNYGKAIFMALKPGTGWQFYFGLAVDKPINLSNLPLIGKELAKLATISIDQLTVIISSEVIDKELAASLDAMIPEGYPKVPEMGMTNRVGLSMIFNFGGFLVPLSIRTAAPSEAETDQPALTGAPGGNQNNAVTASSPGASDGTTWFNIQKSFGPVTFQKVGVKYDNQILWFVINGSLEMAGLSIELGGLSIGSPLSDFSPRFNLDSLGVDYSDGPLEIGGGLLHVPPRPGVSFEYAGDVIVQATTFGLSAAADYADLNGTPSFFAFGQVKGAFGGPPYFFITGFSGGFGYNRSLRIPGQDEVMNFPLVAGLTDPDAIGGSNPTPLEALEKLTGSGDEPGWLEPQIGQMWLAAGIMFTSFELVNSSALAIVEAGNEFALALIGLSTARFPQAGPVSYAYVELQMEAVFKPAQGVFFVSAMLTPNSFVIDPACMLTGGFAYYMWFGNSGHDGDFVLTLGGYHPNYKPPAHYPVEPRLGFNWSLDSKVGISGGAYFALTPSAIMAGGALDVHYHDGKLKAWFTAHADLIIGWKPFHFLADIGVSVGASYKMDLGFTTKTYKVELGADLQLWGPPTGGTVTVHWWVISFTVDIGAAKTANPTALDWPGFKTLLPETGHICTITALDGLGGEENLDASGQTKRWIVRADDFQFNAASAVPSYKLFVGQDSHTPYKQKDKLNIRPMQKKDLTSTLRLSVKRDDGTEVDLRQGGWTVETNSQNVPKSLWGTGTGNTLEKGDPLVTDQLTGMRVKAPPPTSGNSTGEVDIKNDLSFDPLSPEGITPLQEGLTPAGPLPAADADAVKAIEDKIMSAAVVNNRNALYAALQGLQSDPGTNRDLNNFAGKAGSLFAGEPMVVCQS